MTQPPAAPPALMQVAQRYAQTSRGVVTFQMHRIFDVRSAFQNRHEEIVMQGVYEDGATVRVKIDSYTVNGKAAAAADVSSLEYSWEHPKPGDVFAPPYDPCCLAAYQYQSGDASTFYFSSSVRDEGHGRGRFTYDSQDDVVSITYEPNVLPPHATSGTISDLRAQVLPGYWAITQEVQQYKGSYGPFAASGTMQLAFSNFRRFPDLASAIQSL